MKKNYRIYLAPVLLSIIILSASSASALMAAPKIKYTLSTQFTTTAGTDFISGNQPSSTSAINNLFNPPHTIGHKFYGNMDYFNVSIAHNKGRLWDSYLHLNTIFLEKLSAHLLSYYFEFAGKIANNISESIREYPGDEIDLTLDHTIKKDIKLTERFSQMFANKSMRYVKKISPLTQIK